jgi:hypothetical protein
MTLWENIIALKCKKAERWRSKGMPRQTMERNFRTHMN